MVCPKIGGLLRLEQKLPIIQHWDVLQVPRDSESSAGWGPQGALVSGWLDLLWLGESKNVEKMFSKFLEKCELRKNLGQDLRRCSDNCMECTSAEVSGAKNQFAVVRQIQQDLVWAEDTTNNEQIWLNIGYWLHFVACSSLTWLMPCCFLSIQSTCRFSGARFARTDISWISPVRPARKNVAALLICRISGLLVTRAHCLGCLGACSNMINTFAARQTLEAHLVSGARSQIRKWKPGAPANFARGPATSAIRPRFVRNARTPRTSRHSRHVLLGSWIWDHGWSWCCGHEDHEGYLHHSLSWFSRDMLRISEAQNFRSHLEQWP